MFFSHSVRRRHEARMESVIVQVLLVSSEGVN